MLAAKEKKLTTSGIVKSILLFSLNFIILLGLICIMIFLNHPSAENWITFLQENFSNLCYMVVCLFFLVGIVYLYFFFEDKSTLLSLRKIELLFSIFYICIIASYLCGRYVDIYARPIALLALLTLFLLGRRQAIFLNFIFAITMFVIDTFASVNISATMNNIVYSSLIIAFSGGMFAVFLANKASVRIRILLTGLLIAIPTDILIALLQVSDYGSLSGISVLEALGFGLLGCFFSVLLFLAFLPIFEWAFSCLTVFRLRELTSPSAKLLQRLKVEAPGTYHHSMIVAQLSENCASALGENTELARAAAYYHDVGKLNQPEFFTENQVSHNLHDELNPELSADIIRSHTKDGYDLIKQAHLPQFFADIAMQHHGTMPIKYFYAKALRYSDGEMNMEDYSYQGPRPQSKIAAIIMLCDASEAATRSLKERSPENVEKLVRDIIEERMDLDQFSECDITMNDLTLIRHTIVTSLTGFYHHRIQYPAIRFIRGEKENEK